MGYVYGSLKTSPKTEVSHSAYSTVGSDSHRQMMLLNTF
jgi:hypothetical protein